ncbi:gamma-glutamylcyclotransferase [Jannaschia sp. Os4]|uniref:gamma-glutamylcyclotransferase family protein n=1 Tax=Jannaschia sp. Os4 TaxID=2807617 RepID=UPI00193A0EC8|nr:gamma-glutamylcyclotransferase family protein [Jannaschia sp. Os4]MBM2576905.1 gamma-glutamylcyclotransferase [Jannaschia sp. Os4]
MDRFFGYGNLVNRATHAAGGVPMVVEGWTRAWRRTPSRDVAYLTALPRPGVAIAGLAAVPDDWAALDAREAAYVRVPLPEGPVIYRLPEGGHLAPTAANPILLSYLDVVVQGYLREFGEAGVAAFFETTEGWGAPIRDDRGAPAYPRAQPLAPEETALVDRWLREVGG